jgi:D-serine deaminase-like pyridoxal phosphate-dependent protein
MAQHLGESETEGSVGRLNKGLGLLDWPMRPDEIAHLGWNVLHEDLTLPTAVLYADKLANNLKWMQQFIRAYNCKLAPHGKTTMVPKFFARQLEAGAWGITLATSHQTQVAYEHGVRRVLMANQLVGKQNLAIIARLLKDRQFDYFCLVDSAENVEQLGAFFKSCGGRLNCLVELGVEGGRTGVRDAQQLEALLGSLSRNHEHVVLSGVEVFEGVLDDEIPIRNFLRRAVELTTRLSLEHRFHRSPVILSGAGSAWYDVVAEEFSRANIGQPVDVVLRPGCYLTHDAGIYRAAQQKIQGRNSVAQRMHSGLVPALQVWAYVLSVPEKRKAIVGLGKRDAAFDAGLPIPALHFRPGNTAPVPASSAWEVTKMMDQHAYLCIPEAEDIRVGDMIGFDISHPCLTFDKWRFLHVLNRDYTVIDIVKTFF